MRLLFSLLITSLALHSQSYEITLGKEFANPEKGITSDYIGSDENHFFALRYKTSEPGSPTLFSFNRQTSAVEFEKKVELKAKEFLLDTYYKGGKILMFTKIAGTVSYSTLYLLRVFDNKTGNMINDVKVVEEVEVKSSDDECYLTTDFSPDDKKLLTLLFKRNAVAGSVIAKLYEVETFKMIWEKQPAETIDKSYITSANYTVDNENRFIYTAAYLKPGSTEDVLYAICIHPNNSLNKDIIRIPSENKTLISPTIDFVGNELICTGSFFDGNHTSHYKAEKSGLFTLFIDLKNSQIKTESFEYLSEAFQEKFTAFVQSTPSFDHQGCYVIDKELYVVKYYGYNLNTYRGDALQGDRALIGSQEFVREILVLKYNLNKKLEWMQLVPHCTAVGANAIQVVCTKSLNILYYDSYKNIKNFPDPNAFLPAKYKVSGGIGASVNTVCVYVDKTGFLKREIIQRPDAALRLWQNSEKISQGENLPLLPEFNKESKNWRINFIKFN